MISLADFNVEDDDDGHVNGGCQWWGDSMAATLGLWEAYVADTCSWDLVCVASPMVNSAVPMPAKVMWPRVEHNHRHLFNATTP